MKKLIVNSLSITLITLTIIWFFNFVAFNPKNIKQFDDIYKHSAGFTFTNGTYINLNITIENYKEKLDQETDLELKGAISIFTGLIPNYDKNRVMIHPFCSLLDGFKNGPWIEQVYDYSTFRYSLISRLLDFRPSMKPFYKWSEKQYKRLDNEIKKNDYKNKGFIIK